MSSTLPFSSLTNTVQKKFEKEDKKQTTAVTILFVCLFLCICFCFCMFIKMVSLKKSGESRSDKGDLVEI